MEYFDQPDVIDMDKIKELVKTSEYLFIESNINFMGKVDKKSTIFRKGRLLFTSSNHSVLSVNSAGQGVSVVVNPTQIDSEPDLIKLEENVLKELKYGNSYISSCKSYSEMLKEVKKIANKRNNNILYKFFVTYREIIEDMAKLF